MCEINAQILRELEPYDAKYLAIYFHIICRRHASQIAHGRVPAMTIIVPTWSGHSNEPEAKRS